MGGCPSKCASQGNQWVSLLNWVKGVTQLVLAGLVLYQFNSEQLVDQVLPDTGDIKEHKHGAEDTILSHETKITHMKWVLFMALAISGAVSIIHVTFGKESYKKSIASQNNTTRWMFKAITDALMYWSLCIISNIKDFHDIMSIISMLVVRMTAIDLYEKSLKCMNNSGCSSFASTELLVLAFGAVAELFVLWYKFSTHLTVHGTQPTWLWVTVMGALVINTLGQLVVLASGSTNMSNHAYENTHVFLDFLLHMFITIGIWYSIVYLPKQVTTQPV